MGQIGSRAAPPAGHLVSPFVLFFFGRSIDESLVRFRDECDPEGLGSLDRDAFAQGMTRIDEELRRAQVLGRAGAGSGASGRAPRQVPSRPILR
jgi:hypothetical protein